MSGVYRVWSMILFVAVLAQIGLAGVGAFHASSKLDKDSSTLSHDGFFSWFNPHIALGYILVVGALVLLIIAAIGHRTGLRWSAILLGLLVLQVLLAWLGGGVPALGWLHPLNALAIAYVLYAIALGGRHGHRAAVAQPAP